VFLGILFLTARASSHVTTQTVLAALVVHPYVLLAQLVSQWSTKLAFLAVTPTAIAVGQIQQFALHARQVILLLMESVPLFAKLVIVHPA